MKLRALLALALGTLAAASCKKDDDNTPTPVNPTPTDTVYLRGTYSSNMSLTNNKIYVLRGYVYFDAPATLTIEKGTKIISRKDSAGVLIIYKGAKIMAQGEANSPIVFTSGETNPNPGDLGGLVLVGNANGNGNHAKLEGGVDAAHQNFGGSNDGDNSGILKYVRIEYAGKAVNPGDEVNGLSLYAVGSGTTIDYVQVTRGLDDAFEFFGGSVNCKHLIAYNCADDDFDMDDSYKGKIQYAISFKDPDFTDAKGTSGDISNNFEVDNTNGNLPFNTLPRTSPILANFTAVGSDGRGGSANVSDRGYNMRWRRGAAFHLGNSIVIGGEKGVCNLRDTTTIRLYFTGASYFKKCLFYSKATNALVVDNNATPAVWTATDLMARITGSDASMMYTGANDVKLNDPYNVASPNLKPQSGSAALSTTPDWNDVFSDPFFDKVNFVGALDASNDWTTGWTAWNK